MIMVGAIMVRWEYLVYLNGALEDYSLLPEDRQAEGVGIECFWSLEDSGNFSTEHTDVE